MCSRLLATIFIIYCVNSGLCQGIVDLSCVTNKDCVHLMTPTQDATCVDDTCVCQKNETTVICEPPILVSNNLVGGPCPCGVDNASCENQTCKCKEHFTATRDKRRCIPKIVKLDENCETNAQCLANTQFSKCENKTCTCIEKYVRNNGHCLSAIGRKCATNKDCQNDTQYTICSKNQCVCNHSHVASSDQKTCLPNADYLGQCSETAQCNRNLGVGAICEDGMCICNYDHFNITIGPTNRTYCEKIVVPGDYCTQHKECQQYVKHLDEQTMECYMSECNCRPGYQIEGSVCVKSSASRNLESYVLMLVPIFLSPLLYSP